MPEEKVVKLNSRIQYTVEEALAFMQQLVEEEDVERMIILFKDKNLPRINFVCGSEKRDYKLAEVNFDLDTFKLDFLTQDFIPMEED